MSQWPSIRNPWRIALALPLSVALAACAPSVPPVNADAEKAAIAALGDQYVQLFNSKDAAGLAGLYTPDGVRIVPGQATDTGHDAITGAIQRGFDNGSMSLVIQPTETTVAEDGKTALGYGTYEVGIMPPGGRAAKASGGYMNAMVKDAAGAWKIARSMVAPVTPDPIIGTWKLNLAKSNYPSGPAPKSTTIMYETAGNGIKVTVDALPATGDMLHYTYTANFDGKDNPVEGTAPDRDMTARTRVDANTQKSVSKKNGKVTTSQTYVVSPDRTMLTITTTGMTADGRPADSVAVYDRQ